MKNVSWDENFDKACIFMQIWSKGVKTYEIYHYENRPIQIYRKFYHQKLNVFR